MTAHVSQQPNDKQELKPTLNRLAALPEKLGVATELVADSGYFSEYNVESCEKQRIIPYIAVARDQHHPSLHDRFSEPPPLPEGADSVEKMKNRLQTAAGKAVYAQRKATSEPVFGIIKSVMGFRSFLLRDRKAVEGEWLLVYLAFNLKRLHVLKA